MGFGAKKLNTGRIILNVNKMFKFFENSWHDGVI